jgi:putative heme-binding domain-containing protein
MTIPRVLILLCLTVARTLAAELAEGSKPPIREGLQLWLDASRQNAVRERSQLRLLHDGAPIGLWVDGSGHARDFSQMTRGAMPIFHTDGTNAWVRFDGTDDFLAARAADLRPTNLTLFLVVAPRDNPGGFSALFSAAPPSRNDYTHGLNVDLGAYGGTFFNTLNVEGAGAAGMANLLKETLPFDRFHIITILVNSVEIRVSVDGQFQASRARKNSPVGAGHLLLGARYYSNTAEPPAASGFLNGDIAEVLLFDRELPPDEALVLYDHLQVKYRPLNQSRAATGDIKPVIPLAPPPPVQMFLPGFATRELPLSLPNINCVKYRPDGRAVALGYDGRIFLLSDSDGDGLEDRANLFWATNTLRAPIGMALTPPDYRLGDGVFVAAKGKLALIVDTNRDDVADREIIVASGWTELPHGVDALGVAMDAEQNIYFGLGATDFTNPYQRDPATRRSRYSLENERGTILKVSADFQTREIVCTGIRFPVALAFNARGDLFCTDQEGATWLANGNPFDELLHIQRGRHYGFPPQHPDYLPGVIDEPSTFDYEPQHQSTCGLAFNEPVTGSDKIFGPSSWRGDAIVTGYSRGKLYRTKLALTPAGYVAQNQLIGSINALPIDACVTPRGDLLVATHSGQPDWGSGPTGLGKLYQIRYARADLPHPVAAWAASPTETRITFDRALSLDQARVIARTNAILGGKFVDAGSRYESLRPGYQVVQDQMRARRLPLPVLGSELSADRKTVTLRTVPRTEAMNYAVTLSGFPIVAEGLPHEPFIDLAYSLNGVEFSWQGASNSSRGQIPSLDLSLLKTFAADSWPELAGQKGTVRFNAQLNLANMLRPAVQLGATVDYQLPSETVSLIFRAKASFSLNARESRPNKGKHELLFRADGGTNLLPVELILQIEGQRPELTVNWLTAEDSRERPLALNRIFLPWASKLPSIHRKPEPPAELAGANWLNGRRLFFGETAACSKCHLVRGEGFKVGPDLSNLVHRDYASVRKDVLQPNAALNPDHIAYEVQLHDGEDVSGVLLAETEDEIILARAGLEPLRLNRAKIKKMKASSISLMPEGIDQLLSEAQLNDVLAFLLVSPIEPATLQTKFSAKPRSVTELPAIPPSTNHSPFTIVLVSGPKDHGPDEHDYPLWQQRWNTLLSLAEGVQISSADAWPSAEQLATADVLVLNNNNPGWSAARARELRAFQQRGGGLVFIHYAVDGHGNVKELSDIIGLAWKGGASKFRHGPLTLKFGESAHPITEGFTELTFHDESYWQLLGDPSSINVLATAVEDSAPRPLLWTRKNGRGRVFVSILGHYTWTFDDPAFRRLLLRAISWAGHQPAERLSELSTVGATIEKP